VHSEVLVAEFNSAKVGPLQIAVTAEGATAVLATEVSFFHLAFCNSWAMSTEMFLCKMVL
jgi:hypothetical protein